jgi:hypothetical protein
MAAVPLFCRHNRFEANCPICSKEQAASRRPSPSASTSRTRSPSSPAARRHGAGQRGGRVITKRLARAQDDGYRHDLVPGMKATADAERLAACLAFAAARIESPGPHPELAELDGEQATWLAFLLSLAGPELRAALVAANPPWPDGDSAGLGPAAETTIAAYRAWVGRSGSQGAAIAGEPSWSPQRRFARVFDRLSLPGFARAARYEFLVVLGAAGVYELEADALHVNVAHDDATTLAAKRALNSGDAMLLERRAAALGSATGVPIAALDRALALWDSSEPVDAPEHGAIRAALGV